MTLGIAGKCKLSQFILCIQQRRISSGIATQWKLNSDSKISATRESDWDPGSTNQQSPVIPIIFSFKFPEFAALSCTGIAGNSLDSHFCLP